MRGSLVAALLLFGRAALAGELIEGEVPSGGPDHLLVPFEVPEGTVEIEVRHERLSERNVLDYGLFDPERFRGWGGSNSEPFTIGLDEASRSYLPGPMPAGTWHVVIGKAVIAEPAAYALEITLRTEPTLEPRPGRGTYQPEVLEHGPHWYAGDFHVHSRDSGDASATLEEIAVFAEGRGLDFVVITDHNTSAQVDFLTDVQSRHPGLLLIPGAELTTYAGHANGIGVSATLDYFVGLDGVTIETLARQVLDGGGVFSINHPVLDLGERCIGCLWEQDLPLDLIGGVEIGTGSAAILYSQDTIAFWEDLLRRGARPAAIGGSDDHRAGRDTGAFAAKIGSPTTMVYAEELSPAGIVEGVRRGRTVVKLDGPGDPMVELSVKEGRVEATVTGALGQEVSIVENGRERTRSRITSDPFTSSLSLSDGEARYHAEVFVDGGLRTVSSHVFVGARPSDGCGCRAVPSSSGALGWMVPTLVWLFGRSRSRRRAAAAGGPSDSQRGR